MLIAPLLRAYVKLTHNMIPTFLMSFYKRAKNYSWNNYILLSWHER